MVYISAKTMIVLMPYHMHDTKAFRLAQSKETISVESYVFKLSYELLEPLARNGRSIIIMIQFEILNIM